MVYRNIAFGKVIENRVKKKKSNTEDEYDTGG